MTSPKLDGAAPTTTLPPGSGTAANAGTGAPPPKEDSVLESLGKAITDPIATAAEEEEPDARGLPPVIPGG